MQKLQLFNFLLCLSEVPSLRYKILKASRNVLYATDVLRVGSNQVPESSVTNATAMTHPRLRAGHLYGKSVTHN